MLLIVGKGGLYTLVLILFGCFLTGFAAFTFSEEVFFNSVCLQIRGATVFCALFHFVGCMFSYIRLSVQINKETAMQ